MILKKNNNEEEEDNFRKEKEIIKNAENFVKNHEDSDELIFEEYQKLLKNYKKLLKQIQYIIKISDNYQQELINTQDKLKKEIEERKKAEKKLKKISTRDQLTGLYNRREFEKIIKKEWKNAIRKFTPISIIMLDIDNFKEFNDTYGHLAGDNCLQKISKIMKNTLKRPRDFVARYGGEEFVAILPDTNQEGACNVAESLRKNIENAKIPHKNSSVSDYVTVSLGVATTNQADLLVYEELLDEADSALYKAKEKGRNRYISVEI